MKAFRLKLSGPVGPDKPISLANVRRQLDLAPSFDCLQIDIETCGGDSDESFSVYEALRALPIPIAAHVERHCLSAGVTLYLAASLRTASATAALMIHPTNVDRSSFSERPTANELRARADSLQKTDDRIIDLLVARTGYSRSFFEEHNATEDEFEAADLIRCGLVHDIHGLTGRCDPAWPAAVKSLQKPANVVLPEYRLTANYFEACRTSAYLD